MFAHVNFVNLLTDDPNDTGVAGVDIYKMNAEGKAVEHQDALQPVGDPKISTLDVKRLGRSAAREIGTFSLKTKGPTPQEVTGKYVVVWQKVGRNWKLAVDIWNDGK